MPAGGLPKSFDLRTDHDREVGESYRDYAARMYGRARAAEHDRDSAHADVERLTALVADRDKEIADLREELARMAMGDDW